LLVEHGMPGLRDTEAGSWAARCCAVGCIRVRLALLSRTYYANPVKYGSGII
jgi:hypothetical protein